MDTSSDSPDLSTPLPETAERAATSGKKSSRFPAAPRSILLLEGWLLLRALLRLPTSLLVRHPDSCLVCTVYNVHFPFASVCVLIPWAYRAYRTADYESPVEKKTE